MIFEPGMPHALLSSVSALFLLPLGPQHLGAGMVAGTVASLGLLALLLRIWAGPWEPRADCFEVRFAALLIVAPLVGHYLLLHDLAILVLAALLLVEYGLGNGPSEGSAHVRVALAVVWRTCLMGSTSSRRSASSRRATFRPRPTPSPTPARTLRCWRS